ncbi:MAG: phospholipase [Chlorobi bacterium]|nr:phospholipase [Chlorobiota bacterium]
MNKNIALVLGSGGARGVAHIGVIHELVSQGYQITSVAGASMGAVIGGIYASGKLDEYEKWICQLDKLDVFNLIDFTLSGSGIIKADRVLNEIRKFIPDRNIEDLPVPFTAIATDIRNKKEICFTTGSLYRAIRASISIPMVVTPSYVDGILLVDGGILNPVPVNRVKRTPGDMLVAVNVTAQIPLPENRQEEKKNSHLSNLTNGKLKAVQEKLSHLFPSNKKDSMGYFELMTETTALMLSQIAKLNLELNPPDLLIEISRQVCGTFEFHKATELVEAGRIAARKALENKIKVAKPLAK